MNDIAIIHITELDVDVLIGVYEHERKAKQPITLELSVTYDAGSACQSDSVDDVVDYWSLTEEVVHISQSSYFLLVESLGNTILDGVMKHQAIIKAVLTIHKPKALEHFDAKVAVVMQRAR